MQQINNNATSKEGSVCFVAVDNWARICKPFKEPRNRFPAWRADMTTVVPTRQATITAGGIYSSESIPGLHKRLQLRALSPSL